MRKFARDVGVNVLANLCAAAVIYLAAVAGGYLSRNPRTEFAAVGVLFVAGVIPLSLLISNVTRAADRRLDKWVSRIRPQLSDFDRAQLVAQLGAWAGVGLVVVPYAALTAAVLALLQVAR
ncbi:hypothetical protein Raf01_28860 [Rugosimonospora africana]|uniref:Uncharacterized protein n=1 Tax=Rugosimonospora africana TaxID=556532 RepID=A0A8J3QPT1_9ACTN|nr:hypothetical protein Raf01_28860 [Rugosimonospora africana]